MDFESYLKTNAQKVEKELDEILLEFLKDTKKTDSKLVPLAKHFLNSCKGGKRIRGVLVKLGYEIASQISSPARAHRNQISEIYKVGAAWEILHTASLIHDDVIDQSPSRRGIASLYMGLGGNHYGESQAISLGDIGMYLPVKIITNCKFQNDKKIKALNHLSQTVINTGLGQILDVELPNLGKIIQEEDVKQLYLLKTAYYTVAGPLIMGAILGGASDKLIGMLGEFGKNLGIAFQIQDDILGVFGTEKETGKSISSDIEEGKNTLLLSYSLKKAEKLNLSVLRQYYGKGQVGEKGLEKVRKVFKKVGALNFAHVQAQDYASKAKQVVSDITNDKKMCKILIELTEFLVERTS